jgi:hypothetical protein
MGKVLVIKGADFSAVAVGQVTPADILWYYKAGTELKSTIAGNFGREGVTTEQYYGPAAYTSNIQGKSVNVVKLFFAKNDNNQGRNTTAEYGLYIMKVGDTVSNIRTPLARFYVSESEWAKGEKEVSFSSIVLNSDEYIGIAMTSANNSGKAVVVPVGIGSDTNKVYKSLYGSPLAESNYVATMDIGFK